MAEARRRSQAAATAPTSEANPFLRRLASPDGVRPDERRGATLSDLTRELFAYLIRFRQLAGSPQPPALAQVRHDLEDIFARMEQGVRDHPPLARSYGLVRYPLAALADEIILDSEWKQAAQWRECLLERRLYGTAEAQSKVFELAREAKRWPQDAAGILYLCLGLGFHGRYTPQDQRLSALKAELLERLPGRPAKPGLAPGATPPPSPAVDPGPASFSAQLGRPSPPRRDRRPGLLLAGLGAAGAALAVWLALPGSPPGPGEVTAPLSSATILAVPAASPPAAPPAEPMALARQTPPAQEAPVPPRDETPTSGTGLEQPPAAEAGPGPASAELPETKSVLTQVATAAEPPPPAPTPPQAPLPRPSPADLPAPAPAQPVASGHTTGFVIQAGLYVGPIQSNRLAENLTQAGFAAWVMERPRPDGKTRYYVLVGPFAQRDMAQKAIQELKTKLSLQTFLTDPEDPGKLVR